MLYVHMNVARKLKFKIWTRLTLVILPDENNIYKVEFINRKDDQYYILKPAEELIVIDSNSSSMSKLDRPFGENIESRKVRKYVVCLYFSIIGHIHATSPTKPWTIPNSFAKLWWFIFELRIA